MSKREAQARIRINKMLEDAGWRFFPTTEGKANIICEHRTTRRAMGPSVNLGDDYEKAPDGFVDYLLLNDQDRPIAVVEAKREGIHPLDGKEQARDYAHSLGVRHIFLSNGQVHYYWDLRAGNNPTRISHLLTLDQLGEAIRWNPDPQKFSAAVVDENYIAVSQDAAWLSYSPAQREEAMLNQKIRLLRDYQLAAVAALQKNYAKGRNRFLFEMATGTGKTLLSAAIAKLFLRSENAHRVLFLVDRLELEDQAWKNFNHYLAKDGIESVIYKDDRDNWSKAQVVITTIQSLSYKNRYLREFSPNDFQFIISDEAHRTISGNGRNVFEYFLGAKLGLTATPKDYLKGVNLADLADTDPRQLESRLLLDTYRTFGCEDGHPTFRFSLLDAVNHQPPYLVNPRKLDGRTDVTTDLLSKEGWATKYKPDDDPDAEEEEVRFGKRDFEKRFFSPETNVSFVTAFLAKAKRDPLTGEIGKTIIFAVSQAHARKLTELLNLEIEKLHPGCYQSDFAAQVTSNIPGAQDMTRQFSNSNLNGKTKWPGAPIDYDSSRTRVCVTVGRMTTGYDCEDLLNVVLARPIFSPTEFIQIKGRGTRLFNFKHGKGESRLSKDKDTFHLFDFFANCEYFEKDFNYDEQITLPPTGGEEGGGGSGGGKPETFTYDGPDAIKSVKEETVGAQGMRVDREAFSTSFDEKAREEVGRHPELLAAVESGDWSRVGAFVREQLIGEDKPGHWTVDRLRDSYGVRRRLTLAEILQKIFGKITRFPTREEIAAEDFEPLLSQEGVDVTKVPELRELFVALVCYRDLFDLVDEGQYARLATDGRLSLDVIKTLGPAQVRLVLDYIKDNVTLNKYLVA